MKCSRDTPASSCTIVVPSLPHVSIEFRRAKELVEGGVLDDQEIRCFRDSGGIGEELGVVSACFESEHDYLGLQQLEDLPPDGVEGQ